MSRVQNKRHSIQVHTPLPPARADHMGLATVMRCQLALPTSSAFFETESEAPRIAPWPGLSMLSNSRVPVNRASHTCLMVEQTILNLKFLVEKVKTDNTDEP